MSHDKYYITIMRQTSNSSFIYRVTSIFIIHDKSNTISSNYPDAFIYIAKIAQCPMIAMLNRK